MRSVPTALRVARVALALLTIAAIAWTLHGLWGRPNTSVVNFFSFFTIESNILVIVVLLVGGLGRPSGPRWDAVRGASTLFIVITGIVYAVLLRGVEVDIESQWANSALHQVTPVLLLLDWLIFPPRSAIGVRTALLWLLYPLAYGVYSLIRGPLAHWYPYPFLDPRPHGYLQVAITTVVLAAFMVGLALLVAWLGSWAQRRMGARTDSAAAL